MNLKCFILTISLFYTASIAAYSLDTGAEARIRSIVEEEVAKQVQATEEADEEKGRRAADDMTRILYKALRSVDEDKVDAYYAAWFFDSIPTMIEYITFNDAWDESYIEFIRNIEEVCPEGFRLVIEKGLKREDLLEGARKYQEFIAQVKERITEEFDGKTIYLRKRSQWEALIDTLAIIKRQYNRNDANYQKAVDQILSAHLDSIIQGKNSGLRIGRDEWTDNIFLGGYAIGRMRSDEYAFEKLEATFPTPDPIKISAPLSIYIAARHFAIAEAAKRNHDLMARLSGGGKFDIDSDENIMFTYTRLSPQPEKIEKEVETVDSEQPK